MKRRITSLALAVMLVLTVLFCTSCQNETAYTLVTKAIEKTEALDSMEAEMKMNINMSSSGMSMEIPMTYDIKAAGLQSENPVTSSTVTMEFMSVKMEVGVYSEGDYLYVTMGEQNYKVKAGEDTASLDAMETIDGSMQVLPEELLKDVQIVINEDGSRTVSVELSDEEFTKIYQELIDSTGALSGSGSDIGTDIAISNGKVSVTVGQDGYVKTYGLSFDMDMEMSYGEESVTSTATVDATIEYKNPGTEVTVTPPDGYKDFEEADSSDITF